MSRTTYLKEGSGAKMYRVSFGEDHAVGFFMQVFAPDDNYDVPIYDEDRLFGKKSARMMAMEIDHLYGINIMPELTGISDLKPLGSA